MTPANSHTLPADSASALRRPRRPQISWMTLCLGLMLMVPQHLSSKVLEVRIHSRCLFGLAVHVLHYSRGLYCCIYRRERRVGNPATACTFHCFRGPVLSAPFRSSANDPIIYQHHFSLALAGACCPPPIGCQSTHNSAAGDRGDHVDTRSGEPFFADKTLQAMTRMQHMLIVTLSAAPLPEHNAPRRTSNFCMRPPFACSQSSVSSIFCECFLVPSGASASEIYWIV